MTPWQPIGSFPHPTEKWANVEEKFLLTDGKSVVIGFPWYAYNDGGAVDKITWWEGDFQFNPTHFMPLPEMPK